MFEDLVFKLDNYTEKYKKKLKNDLINYRVIYDQEKLTDEDIKLLDPVMQWMYCSIVMYNPIRSTIIEQVYV